MKTSRSTLAALALALPSFAVFAQASAPLALPELPASGPAAAARPATPPGPRLRTPAEVGNGAAVRGDLQPERPVAPQINIPLGKKQPGQTKTEARAARRGSAPVTGGIDDAAARCEAQADDQLRATCRAKAARETHKPLPN